MSAIFSRRAATVARAALVAICALVILVPTVAMLWVRTPWARGEHRRIVQPVPFDHRIHVTGLRIDCRYCHSGVERSASAGLPSTQKCVMCHTQLWRASSPMDPIRQSVATGRPIPWRRVTQLPDFVYFNHSIHVNKGVGCETCHGRIDQAAAVEQATPLTMSWCVACHRNPAPSLRPLEAVTTQGYVRPSGDRDSVLAAVLMKRYQIHSLTNCTTCHR